MENLNQNPSQQANPQSNTAVAEPDTMTLGDFMSQNAEAPQDNSVVTVNDFMNGTSTPPHDFKPIDSSAKPDFIKGIGQRMYAGFITGSANYGQMLGEGAIPGMQSQIDKELKDSAEIYKTTKSDNPFAESVNMLAADLGYMGATIPLDFMAGEATMYAAAGKVLPAVESALGSLPSFALGSGWRGLFTSLQSSQKKNENPLVADVKAAGSAAFNVASNTAFAKIGGGWQGATILTTLGGADAYGEAALQGRLPTKEEVTSKMMEGFGMGLVFTILPHLANASKIESEKTAIKGYQDIIDIQMKDGDVQGVRDTVEALKKDTTIRPEIRNVVEKTETGLFQEPEENKDKSADQLNQELADKSKQGKEVHIVFVGEKEKKSSGLSESVITDAIKAGLKESEARKEDLPQHEVRNMDDVGARASEFITNNRDLAMKIAKREAPEQDDLRAEELFTAIRIKAQVEGDIETLLDLARSNKAAQAATEMGQRIKALDAHDPTDIVKSIREVNKARAHESKKSNPKVKSETKKALKIAENESKKLNKPKNWKEFVDSIEC